MEIHHIGYLIDDICQAIDTFRLLGYSLFHEVIYDEDRQAHLALIQNGEILIELVQPTRNSSLWNLRTKFRNTPYHVCYICPNLDAAYLSLRKQGFFPVQGPEVAILFQYRRVCFMMHKQIGLVEFLEDSKV